MFSNVICLLIFVAQLVEASKFTIGLKRHEKNKTLIARDPTTATAAPGTYGQSLSSEHNLEYRGVVSVGTPPQTFEVVFDTGSDVFWLPRIGCSSSGVDVQACASGVDVYNPQASTTSLELTRTFQIQYGTGSASGHLYDDVLSFGDATNPSSAISVGNVTFGAAERMTFSDQGILGLSFANGDDPTPIFQLAVERGVFDEPYFTVYLKKCSHNCDDGGLITFGGFDNEHCDPIVGQTNLLPGTPYWIFALDAVVFQNIRITNQNAIVDTGTSIIIGPEAEAGRILTQIGARSIGGDNYIIDCNAQFSIDFTINGQVYSVEADQLILQEGFGQCSLAFGADPQLDFWILGDPFLRQYCTVHNVANRTLEFAPSKTATHSQGGNGNSGNNGNGNSNGNGNGNNNGNGQNGGRGHGHHPFNPFGNNNNNPFGSPFGNPFGNSFGSPWNGNNNPFGQNGRGNNPFGGNPFRPNSQPFGGGNNWDYGDPFGRGGRGSNGFNFGGFGHQGGWPYGLYGNYLPFFYR